MNIHIQNLQTININIYNGTITLEGVDEDQSDLLLESLNFRKLAKPKNPEKKKQKKKDFLENLYNFFEGRERVLNAFDSKIFLIKIEGTDFSEKVSDHSNLKILSPKQMLQRLQIALAQVKESNTSENLLNEIRQSIYFLYRAKETTRKCI